MADGTFHRGIRDMKIAVWNSENSFGTAYDILGARNMSVEGVLSTDQLEGDDVVLDRYSKIVSVTVSLEMASIDPEAFALLFGGNRTYDANYERWVVGENSDPPYVAIAGRVVGSGASSDLQLFVPKAKVSGNIQFSAQLNTYMLPQAQFEGVQDGSYNGMMVMHKFDEATALEIPLRTTGGGV